MDVTGNLNNPTGTGINRNNVTRNITFENLRVEGYDIGLYVPRRGSSVIIGGYFNNVRNIYMTTAVRQDRSVLITGDVQFGSLSDSALRGRTPYRVVMQHNFNEFQDRIRSIASCLMTASKSPFAGTSSPDSWAVVMKKI